MGLYQTSSIVSVCVFSVLFSTIFHFIFGIVFLSFYSTFVDNDGYHETRPISKVPIVHRQF
jgi:hypothetical protein